MNKLVCTYRGYSICRELITERGKYRDRILGNNIRLGKFTVNNSIITESTKFSTEQLAKEYIDNIFDN